MGAAGKVAAASLSALAVILLLSWLRAPQPAALGATSPSPAPAAASATVTAAATAWPQGNYTWVQDFIDVVNYYRERAGEPPLSQCPVLDEFARIRFETLVSNISITHYGFYEDFERYLGMYPGLYVDEEVLYPGNETPRGMAEYLALFAPVHWAGLLSGDVRYYGAYTAVAPYYVVKGSCPVREFVGEGVDVPEVYEEHNCSFEVENVTWVVVELSNFCYQGEGELARLVDAGVGPGEALEVPLAVPVGGTLIVEYSLSAPGEVEVAPQAAAAPQPLAVETESGELKVAVAPGLYDLVIYNPSAGGLEANVTAYLLYNITLG